MTLGCYGSDRFKKPNQVAKQTKATNLSELSFSSEKTFTEEELKERVQSAVAGTVFVGMCIATLGSIGLLYKEAVDTMKENKRALQPGQSRVERPVDISKKLVAEEPVPLLFRATAELESERQLPVSAIKDPELRKLFGAETETVTFRKYKLTGDYEKVEVTTVNQELALEESLLIAGTLRQTESGEMLLLGATSMNFDFPELKQPEHKSVSVPVFYRSTSF